MSFAETRTYDPTEYCVARRGPLSTTLYTALSKSKDVAVASSGCPIKRQLTVTTRELPQESKEQFETLKPIMGRLPFDPAASQRAEDAPAFEKDYYRTQANVEIPGGLAYDPRNDGVLYTRSRLPHITDASRDLWAALHSLQSVTASYAGDFQVRGRKGRSETSSGCPMDAGAGSALDLVQRVFNWSQLTLPVETEAEFFGVVFRSKRAAGSETTNLMMADKLSHEEAVSHGGLLMYWYGVPDPATGSNLATCIWETQEQAKAASALPLHKEAVKHARLAYAGFELSRYKVVKVAGEVGVHIEDW